MKFNAKDYKPNELLKFIRQGLDLTQDELAKKVNISKSSIEKYEYGTVNYTFETLLNISNKFGIDINIELPKKK